MNDNDNTQASIQQFRAPSWAADWCPKCDWAQTCLDCRACWIG